MEEGLTLGDKWFNEARICRKNCIEIRYIRETKGWFDSVKAFILTPITYHYRSYHSRKPECFSPRTNRGESSSFTFLKE